MTKKIKIVETADTEEIKQQGRMTNAERDRKIKDAEALYIRGYSLQSISELETIGVRIKTLREWEKRYEWKDKKQLYNISPSEIKALIRSNVASIKLGKHMPYKPDDISKMAKAWKEIDDERKKAVYSMEAFDAFIDWFTDIVAQSKGNKREDNLQLLKQIRLLQDNYIQTLST
jgi:putative ATPase subunit of terminase (gpP-like)|nr:MAG TPA: Protein of unknown function (DUF1804) [Bacteriophage sp.]